MPKFIFLYKGPVTAMSDMSPEEVKASGDQWGAWYGKLGSAIQDGGAPFAAGASVVDDGSSGTASDLSGYTVVEAADMNAAKAMTAGHPFLSEGKGKFAIDVFELMPIPGM